MRIAGVGFHTTYQYELAQLGEEYQFDYILSVWNHHMRPQPPNVRLLDEKLPLATYDLILAHSLADALHWQARLANEGARVPMVVSVHTYPPHWDECANSLPLSLRRLPSAFQGCPKVFVSEGSRELWGFADDPESVVIPHAVDGDVWQGYHGSEEIILTVCNQMWAEDRYRGGSLFDLVTEGLPRVVVGDNPGHSVRSASQEALQDAYQSARLFLWTGVRGPTSFSPLEAMATGMPLVTVWTPDWSRLIVDGVNGFVCHDPVGLRRRCERLLADPQLARDVGARGRQTVLEGFHPNRFRRDWRHLLECAAAGLRPARTGES
jgi:glycosyltransferase involved in cell wall biosynthesis